MAVISNTTKIILSDCNDVVKLKLRHMISLKVGKYTFASSHLKRNIIRFRGMVINIKTEYLTGYLTG